MDIKTCILGKISTNCYIVSSNSKEAIIIDPADQAEEIKSQLDKMELTPAAVLLTHGHFDHIMAVPEITRQYHIPVYACKEEKELLQNPHMNCAEMINSDFILTSTTDIQDNELLTLADMEIKVIHTPGHTAGGVCYYFYKEDVLFSGDSLFFESMGRTDFPTGNSSELLKSICNKLMTLPDKVKVYPGHGNSTTIGYEKENNPYFNDSYFWN